MVLEPGVRVLVAITLTPSPQFPLKVQVFRSHRAITKGKKNPFIQDRVLC